MNPCEQYSFRRIDRYYRYFVGSVNKVQNNGRRYCCHVELSSLSTCTWTS